MADWDRRMMPDRLFALGSHVAEREDAVLRSAEVSESMRRRLAEHAARRAQPASAGSGSRRGRVAAYAAGMALAASVTAALSLLTSRDPAPLSFTVGNEARPGLLAAPVSAKPGQPLPMRFSDGTVLHVGPGGRARVVRLAPTGAEVSLESGRTLVEIVPNPGSTWRLRPGPFLIEVKGTRFDVAWDAQADELTLDLFEGRVVVTGCGLGAGRVVAPGERFRASCRATPAPLVQLPPLPAPPPAASGFSTVPSSEGQGQSWRSQARRGNFQEAYRIAVALGFEKESANASAADAMLLGDAARLSARPDEAQQAYLGVRRRFPESDAAARAAFALGRLAFDSGSPAVALRWFESYLAEQPTGSLAAPAFDRLLEAAVGARDAAGTRAIAERYLARYPQGARSAEARRILGVAPVAPMR